VGKKKSLRSKQRNRWWGGLFGEREFVDEGIGNRDRKVKLSVVQLLSL
jgi:hypothetical protein